METGEVTVMLESTVEGAFGAANGCFAVEVAEGGVELYILFRSGCESGGEEEG